MKFLIPFLFIASCLNSQKQQTIVIETSEEFSFNKVSTLPLTIKESSGLTVINDQIITHNDSGNDPTIFRLDRYGNQAGMTYFKNAENRDWEAITNSPTHLFIGDIGNNKGNREDLVVYKIKLDGISENSKVTKLNFSYPDQKSFKNKNHKHAFDAESLLYIDDFIYIFSKDWIDFSTTIYKLNPSLDNQVAEKIITFKTGFLVTDATINDKKIITLCGYNSGLEPFLANIEYKDSEFKYLGKENIPLESAQIEAITYYGIEDGKEIYYLTSEAVNIKLGQNEANFPGEFYRLTRDPK